MFEGVQKGFPLKIVPLKKFHICSVDECNGRWYSTKLKYKPKYYQNIFNHYHPYYQSFIVSDLDQIDDLAETMRSADYKITILDNCLIIKLTTSDDDFNLENIQQYLKKRQVSTELVELDDFNNNKGNGYLLPSWFM